MNKTELINAVAEKTGMQKKDTEKAVAAVFETIVETLANGDRVQIVGFGNFEVRERKARTGRHPRTKEPMPIPASKLPVFRAGVNFKNSVSGEKK